MIPNIDGSLQHDFAPHDDSTFRLGFKELIFLAFILFFGFCGFTFCVDKIYSSDSSGIIDKVTVHDHSISSNARSSAAHRDVSSYEVN